MLSITIRDHSPMDDYKKIQSKTKYIIQYAPFDTPDKPDRMENLTGSSPYKIIYGLIIRLFILTGVGIVVSIVAGFWFSYDSSSELKRIIFILLIVASSAAFFIALLLQSLKQLQQD